MTNGWDHERDDDTRCADGVNVATTIQPREVLDDELARPPAEVAKAAVELGERLIVALRAKLLPAQLGRLAPR